MKDNNYYKQKLEKYKWIILMLLYVIGILGILTIIFLLQGKTN